MSSIFGCKPYVIAEIGANHNGDMDIAREMIRVAKKIGCDCVKFQSFDERLFAREVYDRGKFLDDGRDVKNDLRTAVRAYSLSHEQIKALCACARDIGIHFSSSAFEPDQIDVLVEAEVDFIKVASMDVANPRLLTAIGKTGRPVVLSTGMASLEEIAAAIDVLEATGNRDIVLLHCVSLYPSPDEAINLNNMDMLRECFGYPVGFSDHSVGVAIPLAAVAKGGTIVEKHFTLDKSMEGWDHAISADPAEMQLLVEGARRVHAALGHRRRVLSVAEIEKRQVMRRSIVAARRIPAGKVIEPEDLTYRRPGTGISPVLTDFIVGMKAVRDVEEGELLCNEDLGRLAAS